MSENKSKKYWYCSKKKYLFTEKDHTKPFLCPVMATPIEFSNAKECVEFLDKNNYDGKVVWTIRV